MTTSAIPASSGASYPSPASTVQSLESQERAIQKQIAALAKNTQLDVQTKAQELAQLESSLQEIQVAIQQSQIAQAKENATGGGPEKNAISTSAATTSSVSSAERSGSIVSVRV